MAKIKPANISYMKISRSTVFATTAHVVLLHTSFSLVSNHITEPGSPDLGSEGGLQGYHAHHPLDLQQWGQM